MRVIRADALGMCFGVRDALAAVRTLPDPEDVWVHGELVHNEVVIRELTVRGFRQSAESDRERLPETNQVVVTAHGISERERRRLESAGRKLIDTTCPLVRRAHAAAQDLQRRGYFVVVIGRPGHVEVEGIVGDLTDFTIVPGVADVRRFGATRLGVMCQTTTPPAEAAGVLAAIREHNPHAEVRFVDTICRPTRERQTAVQALLDEVEALVVVGGARSNNTRQLAALAEARGVPVARVASAAELDRGWLARFAVVGLTAGTSTLDETVEEVAEALAGVSA
jgi:4-hydroxy-3-methylbut-2-enyl diphosphate reductase